MLSEKADETVEATPYSPVLFKIASTEVKQNIAVLHRQLDELRTAVQPIVQYDFMRAAHTLAGVSRTMGFAAVVELAYALESWLLARLEKKFTLHETQLLMLEQAVAALDEMIQSVCNKEIPQMRGDLVNQLLSDKDNFIEVVSAPAETKSTGEQADLEQPYVFVPQQQEDEANEPQVIEGMNEWLLAENDKLREVLAEHKAKEIELQPDVFNMEPTVAYAGADKPAVIDDVDEQLLPVFLEEADDLCPKISEGLRIWREPPHDGQQVPLLKRLLHTMKGSSRMVGAMRIGEIAHEMEGRVLEADQFSDEAGYWDDLESDFDHIMALLKELRGGKPARRNQTSSDRAPRGRSTGRGRAQGRSAVAGAWRGTCHAACAFRRGGSPGERSR